jgi:predicted HicB family RNase H-like nuclease
MSDMMSYKGYRGQIEFSEEDETFYGWITGINDLVTFEGTSVQELRSAFTEAVNDYLDTCKSLGKKPEKEYKGQFNVRISRELHRLAAMKATTSRISLNKFVERAIRKAVQGEDV